MTVGTDAQRGRGGGGRRTDEGALCGKCGPGNVRRGETERSHGKGAVCSCLSLGNSRQLDDTRSCGGRSGCVKPDVQVGPLIDTGGRFRDKEPVTASRSG